MRSADHEREMDILKRIVGKPSWMGTNATRASRIVGRPKCYRRSDEQMVPANLWG